MTTRNYDDWLEAFVQHASIGEAPLDLLWWVGVSTVAGALRRRVWIDQATFQWVPNFYIVAVAPPGVISKTTTANVGFRLLWQVDGIHKGPDISSWESLIQEMAKLGESVEFNDGRHYEMSALTVALDEYGTFIDPADRQQVDILTSLWDGKQGTVWKATKTQGHDHLVSPWLNMFACTTPKWFTTNFPESFLESGFFSRHIFVVANQKRQRVAYPGETDLAAFHKREGKVLEDLRDIAEYAGSFRLTRDAVEWGTEWYNKHWDKYERESRERLGFPARKQTHMHKLAMVLSAARGDFPAISAKHLQDANAALERVEPGINALLAGVGTTNVTRAGREIVEFMELEGRALLKSDLFRKYFFRRMSRSEFEEALAGAVHAGYVEESPDKTVISLKRKLES